LASPPACELHPVSILIVDDQQENLLAIEAVLGGLGAELVRAGSGADALKRVLERDFAVILLDVQMPGMDGYETARLIRERERSRHTPLLFLTAGGGEDAQIARAYSAGAVDFLVKPFDPAVLTAKAATFVQLARQAESLRRVEHEVRQLNEDLERRVEERTHALEQAGREREEVLRKHRDAEERLALLAEASEALLGSLDPAVVVPAILDISRRLFAAEAYAVWRRSPETGHWTIVADLNLSPGYPRSAPETPRDRPAHPFFIEDVRADPSLAPRRGVYDAEGIRAILSLPLRIHGQQSGSIAFYYREPRRFDATEIRVAGALANLAASALGTSELYAEQQRLSAEAHGMAEDLRYVTEHAQCLLWHAVIEGPREPGGAFKWDLQVFDEAAAQRYLPLDRRPDESFAVAFYRNKPREDQVYVDSVARDALENDRSSYSQEYRCRRADGEMRWMAEETHLERLDAHRWRAVGVCTDITARKRLEGLLRERLNELADADRRKDFFLSMLAHELRNPLGAVSNALHVMRRAAPGSSVYDRARESALRQLAHQSRMVDDLLDVSRITRGSIDLRREQLDLARLVSETVDDHRAGIEAKGITVTVETPPEPIPVEGDPTRLVQILVNLLDNAGKFTPPGGRITVRCGMQSGMDGGMESGMEGGEQDGHAWASVRDTGTGIDAALLPGIFEPFTQARQNLDRPEGGLGLGLTLARGLAESHGGTLEAASPGEGAGSEFTLRLPLSNSPPIPAPVPDIPLFHPSSFSLQPSKRVLVVEDNLDAAETLSDLLETFGYEVRLAHTGPDGVQAAREYLPEIVLCDIGLPGMDGYQVASHLRGDPATADARLIAVTGYGGDADRRMSEEAGFEKHLTKPIDPEELQRLLAAAR